jgi:hypothetical protein
MSGILLKNDWICTDGIPRLGRAYFKQGEAYEKKKTCKHTLAIVDFCNKLLKDCHYHTDGTMSYILNKNVKDAWNTLYAQTYVLWDIGRFLEVTWKDSPLEGALPQQPDMDKLACLERKMAHPKYDTHGTDNPLSISRLTLYS